MALLVTHLSVIGSFFLFMMAFREGMFYFKKQAPVGAVNTKVGTMENSTKLIESFFVQYEERINESLTNNSVAGKTAADSFADCFIEASPNGVRCATNDAEFKENMQRGYALYKQMGAQSLKILSLEITPLISGHFLTKLRWRGLFVRKDNKAVAMEFDIFYLVQAIDSSVKIFAYVAEDEQQTFKELGLEPFKRTEVLSTSSTKY